MTKNPALPQPSPARLAELIEKHLIPALQKQQKPVDSPAKGA